MVRNFFVIGYFTRYLKTAFCYNCKLFLNATAYVPLVQDGFYNWQHLTRHLQNHGKSNKHAECTNKLINLRENLKTENTENTVYAHHQNLM